MTIASNNLIAAITGGVWYKTSVPSGTPSDRLYTSPASIMTAYIIDELELMSDPSDEDDWPLYISSMPDEISNCGTVYDTSGLKDGRLMVGPVIQHQGIQLRIRANNYEIGNAKIEEIAVQLDAIKGSTVVLGERTYKIYNASRTSNILFLRVEPENRRSVCVINYLMTVKDWV